MIKQGVFLLFLVIALDAVGQSGTQEKPGKVAHAEPIYIDLIRDLGARKGERELNIGMGMASVTNGTEHTYFIEYEFAPVNRLGLEVEVPLAFHRPAYAEHRPGIHGHDGVEGVKMAVQYSFFVSTKRQTTMAIGYIFETLSGGFNIFRYTGSVHNPFFILAKKFGDQFHTLVYTGPLLEFNKEGKRSTGAVVNANVHYVLRNSKHFAGIEVNKKITDDLEMMIRPQLKLALSRETAIGLAIGIPAHANERKMDFLLRYIHELGKKRK